MFLFVVSLSQPSSRDLLYVKCLCVLSRYHSPVVEIPSLSQPSSIDLSEICYMLNVCVCVAWLPQCVVSLSQPISRDLIYAQ